MSFFFGKALIVKAKSASMLVFTISPVRLPRAERFKPFGIILSNYKTFAKHIILATRIIGIHLDFVSGTFGIPM